MPCFLDGTEGEGLALPNPFPLLERSSRQAWPKDPAQALQVVPEGLIHSLY